MWNLVIFDQSSQFSLISRSDYWDHAYRAASSLFTSPHSYPNQLTTEFFSCCDFLLPEAEEPRGCAYFIVLHTLPGGWQVPSVLTVRNIFIIKIHLTTNITTPDNFIYGDFQILFFFFLILVLPTAKIKVPA